MKIIQTSWSCNQQSLFDFSAGWHSPEYHLMGWALSCLQLRKYYKDVVLYADNLSVDILINKLQLPYTQVIDDLDRLNHYHPQLWALPKIDSYMRQECPFLHVDGDVFIWEAFPDDLLSSGLIAQNRELSTDYYEPHMVRLENNLPYFPEEVIEARRKYNPIQSYNAGILGGNDIPFFKEYGVKALEFVRKNEKYLSRIDIQAFNVFFEQYLFYSLVKKQQKHVAVLIEEIFGNNKYIGFGEFCDVPHKRHFLHLLGPYKRSKYVCEQMASRLRLDYPEYYYRIISLFKQNDVPLKKDYYCFVSDTSERSLIERYNRLKENKWPQDIKLVNKTIPSRNVHGNFLEDVYKIVIKKGGNSYDQGVVLALKKDIKSFERKLNRIINQKFNKYSNENLYSRDIKLTSYYQIIFETISTGYEVKLVVDPTLEIIDCKYNWYQVYSKMRISLNTTPVSTSVGVVPECDSVGYSLLHIDSLDLIMLNLLKKPTNIKDLFHGVGRYFEDHDLGKPHSKLEALIIDRIKLAIHSKIIKIDNN